MVSGERAVVRVLEGVVDEKVGVGSVSGGVVGCSDLLGGPSALVESNLVKRAVQVPVIVQVRKFV